MKKIAGIAARLAPLLWLAALMGLAAWFLFHANPSQAGNMVIPTVVGPHPDGVDIRVPNLPGNRELARLGMLDVTAAPFKADPQGQKDSTRAIRKAVRYARDRQMVCFFPPGKYLVSDTIECIQPFYRRTSGRAFGARDHPCLLMGSRKGKRPIIVLAANSPGYGDRARPKYVLHFWARNESRPSLPQANINFNQMLVNIDVTIGPGNPGAVAIRHRGAQGSGIQECTIDATHGLTGIEGGCGSGGSHLDITVIGGEIGLDLRQTQPAPTIAGITLIGQKNRALLYTGRQALSAVGVRIVFPGPGPAVESRAGHRWPHHGQICLADASIEVAGGPAMAAGDAVFLSNVFTRGASSVAADLAGDILVPARPSGWTRVKTYARGVDQPDWEGRQYTAPVYVDGRVLPGALTKMGEPGPPPADLVSRHLWTQPFPGFESPEAVPATAPPYAAAGDGIRDDAPALQKALDQNRTVFLPKGYYALSQPLRLNPGNRLVGAARHLSVLTPLPGAAAFADPAGPAPLVDTADSAESDAVLACLGIYAPPHFPGAYHLRWRLGGEAMLRDVYFMTSPPPAGFAKPGNPPARNHPLVLVQGNGGGRWYNFFQESWKPHGPDFRHLLVKDSHGGLSIYQCNPEHSRGRCNMEISRSSDVTVYGLKSEGNQPILEIIASQRIRVLGYGGPASGLEGGSLFRVADSRDVILAALVDTPRISGGADTHFSGRGTDPALWSMVSYRLDQDADKTTRPFERPAAFIITKNPGGPKTK